VIGSRGSVVPYFQKLIADGAEHLPITDPRMTRFWITLPQGVDFVCSCLKRMRGGEVFVPKIPSMKVIDVARVLAPNLPHKIVGIRPGEKLHEVMITEDDARNTRDLGDCYAIMPSIALWSSEANPSDGRAVAESFRYASDVNEHWLTPDEMRKLAVGGGQ
jgi:UDP-N-acetylglucosamine 4,6-dehydratase/5-epimerase